MFKLPKPSAVGVGIETSQQNTVLCMAILTITIQDEKELDRALGIPLIYTAVSWVVDAIYIGILYKLGWTFNVNVNVNSNNDTNSNNNKEITQHEQLNLCVLIQRYKESKSKIQFRLQQQEQAEQPNTPQLQTLETRSNPVENDDDPDSDPNDNAYDKTKNDMYTYATNTMTINHAIDEKHGNVTNQNDDGTRNLTISTKTVNKQGKANGKMHTITTSTSSVEIHLDANTPVPESDTDTSMLAMAIASDAVNTEDKKHFHD